MEPAAGCGDPAIRLGFSSPPTAEFDCITCIGMTFVRHTGHVHPEIGLLKNHCLRHYNIVFELSDYKERDILNTAA
jgi:hypothetical protein